MKKIMRISVVVLFLFVGYSFSAEMDLGLKSAALPGLGQLSAGQGNLQNTNTLKGIGFMTGFVFGLHGIFSQAGAMDSYAQQTASLKSLSESATSYSERDIYNKKHKVAFDNYESARLKLILFSSFTAIVYGFNIADAMLFTKKEQEGLSRFMNGVSIEVSTVSDVPTLGVNCSF